MKIIELSIVSPVYMAEHSIEELVARICEECENLEQTFEIILIDDYSPDTSWNKIQTICKENSNVKAVKLSRNFGQHAAITAGLDMSQGNFVVVMDCDLQDNPKYIPELYKKAKQGFDIVYTEKRERKHSFFKNVTAFLFTFIFNWLSDSPNQKTKNEVGAYSILTRKVVCAFLKINDYQRHYLMVLRWLGFNHTFLEIDHYKRPYSKSSYTFRKLLKHAINGVTAHSDKLLYLSVNVGLLFFVVALISSSYLIVSYFLHGFQEGWTSLMVLILLSTGLILMSLGIVGIYLGKTFEQSKNRPLYIIDSKLNF